MQTIAIVGGGFSGTLTAVNLVRLTHIPLRVLIINAEYPLGRGIAYSTKLPEHLLNVAARNMSALADHPNHFVDWLKTRCEYTDVPESILRETFIPRRVYGDYLRGLLQAYAVPITHRDEVQIDFVSGEVIDIDIESGRAILLLSSGERIEAEKVVLATGNQKPAEFCDGERPFRHPCYCENPWTSWEERLPDVSETIVLLGTGLTTIDAIIALEARRWQGTIYAVSRNGLLPQSHFRGIEYPDFPPSDPTGLGLKGLVSLMEEHCLRLREIGANPAIVVDKLRPYTQRIWRGFSDEERRAFLQQYAHRWNVTRHRIAQEIHRQVTAAIDEGRLRIVTGTVVELKSVGTRVHVIVQGASGTRVVLDAAFVVNGTGPRNRFSETENQLLRNLLKSQRLKLDSMDMGIEVDDDFAVIDARGDRSKHLHALGPILKGSLWETIAVPELRGQTLRVAQSILEELGGDKPRLTPWPSTADYGMLEYCI